MWPSPDADVIHYYDRIYYIPSCELDSTDSETRPHGSAQK